MQLKLEMRIASKLSDYGVAELTLISTPSPLLVAPMVGPSSIVQNLFNLIE
jgi:hypothetical protein